VIVNKFGMQIQQEIEFFHKKYIWHVAEIGSDLFLSNQKQPLLILYI
jgi:hypothetical protein